MRDLESYIIRVGGYDEALGLYEKYGSSSVLLAMFKNSKDGYNKNRIFKELKAIYDALPVNQKKEAPKVSNEQIPVPSVPAADMPPILQELKRKRIAVIKEMGFMHSQLMLLDDETRFTYALKIKDLSLKHDTWWMYEDYWTSYARLHPDLKEKPVQIVVAGPVVPADYILQRNKLRSNISKWKKKAATYLGVQKEFAEEKLNDFKERLAQLERQYA